MCIIMLILNIFLVNHLLLYIDLVNIEPKSNNNELMDWY
jgi:hypothetical protein